MTGGFAESTIEAAIYVITNEPHNLQAWLAEHPPGARLEKIARTRIKERQQERERATS